MLITTRELRCFGELVPANHPIPEPTRWDPSALQSCINVGWVREASIDEEKEIEKRLKPIKAHSESEAKRLETQGALLEIFKCEKCPEKMFKSAAGLKSHIRAAHN